MKVFIAKVEKHIYSDALDHDDEIKVFRFIDDATAWAKNECERCMHVEYDENMYDEDDTYEWIDNAFVCNFESDDNGVNFKCSYEVTEQDVEGYADAVPTVMVSIEDFEWKGFDTSGLSDYQKYNILNSVSVGMNNNDCVMDCFWQHIELVGGQEGLPRKYDEERYAEVEIVYNGDSTWHHFYIAIGDDVEEGSYEDENVFFHVNTHEELLALTKEDNGEDFVVKRIYGYCDEI